MLGDDGAVPDDEHTGVGADDGLERHGVDGTEDLFCRLRIQSYFFRKGVDVILAGAGEEIAFLAAQRTVGIETQQFVGLLAVGLMQTPWSGSRSHG